MKVGDLVMAKNPSRGIYGINLETGEYIRIKSTAPPQIITKSEPPCANIMEVEIYLSWRNEYCIVPMSDLMIISEA